MIHGIFLGLILFAALVYSVTSGISFYEPDNGMHSPVGLYVAIVVVLLFGVSLYLKKARALALARRWPCVSGVIDEAITEGSLWRIQYHYRVNDTPYYGSVFSLESSLADPVDVALHITRKPLLEADELAGRLVKVYYNPSDANTSVLYHVTEPDPWALAIPATVSIGAMGLMSFIMVMARIA